MNTGAAAYRIEQTVLKQLRAQRHGPCLTVERIPAGGWTETFDAAALTATALCSRVTHALTTSLV